MYNNTIKTMISLTLMLGQLLRIIVLAALSGIVGSLLSIGVTLFGALALAKILGANIALSYEWLVVFCILCGVFRGILRYLEQYLNHYVAFKSLAIIRDKIFTALRALCPAKLESKQKGSIIAMISADVETLEIFYAHTISPIMIALGTSLAIMTFVGVYASWYIALAAGFCYCLVGVVLPPLFYKYMKDTGEKYREQLSSLNVYLLDSIRGNNDIVLNNAGDRRKNIIAKRSDNLLKRAEQLNNKNALTIALTQSIVTFCHFLVIIVAGLLVFYNKAQFNDLLVAVVAIISSFGPVVALSSLPASLTQTFTSGNRVLSLLAEKPQTLDIKNGTDFTFSSLAVENLSFSYDDQTNVLKNCSLVADEGSIVGIVGKSGSGKSTLLKLLLRFWQKNSGYIKYGDKEIEQINTSSLLQNVTMVSQNTYLFNDTIGENLKIAKPSATDDELNAACSRAAIYDLIASLPNGFATSVGQLGNNLSSGEKQRLGLARAFLRGSSLILLDEPTSYVDSINEGIILNVLKNQQQHKTIILVSHRESTMAIADKIVRFKDFAHQHC